MRVSYNPTFSHFVDNYLATYFSGGVGTLRRIAGGPFAILFGALVIITANAGLSSATLSTSLIVLGALLILAGLFYTLQPLFNIFLVWLRRDEFFGSENGPTVVKLSGGQLHITERGESVNLLLEQIKSIQHRAESTWILTHGDYLIAIPRSGLLEGDHDRFIDALEEALAPPEEKDEIA